MASDLGLDRSGNNHHFLVSNMTFDDQVVDSPSNNFAALNSSSSVSSATGTIALSEGNLRVVCPVSGNGNIFSNIGVSSGKWYAEFYLEASTGAMRATVAVSSDPELTRQSNYNIGHLSGARDVGYMGNDGEKFVNNSESSYGTAFSNGDIIGCALDVDNDTVNFNNNGGSWKGTISIASTIIGAWHIGCGDVSGGYGETIVANFGQDSSFAGGKTAQGNQDSNDIGDFYYTPPSGFLALCTSNLPDVDVVPSEHFNTVVYSGTGSNGNAVTGVGFQPDLVWLKSRSGGRDHIVVDAVRGNTKFLMPNVTTAEETGGTDFQSFDSDGFTVGASTVTGGTNYNGESFASWNWKANGTGSSNTDGSINTTSTSVNTDAGFSISTWTGNATSGASIGHGLSVKPDLIISRQRSGANNWLMYHKSLGATKYIAFEVTDGSYTVSNIWNDQEPTTSVFYVGNNASANGNTETYVTYCFHGVDGYSKFGSYIGNGNTDGPFIYTGFRPAYVQWKKSNAHGQIWQTFGYVGQAGSSQIINPLDRYLASDSGGAEGDYDFVDFTSNGFKLRHNSTHANADGDTYIYMAFAETPFKYANAR